MVSLKTLVLACALIVPFSVSLADDEITQTLHNNTYQESASAYCLGHQGACGAIMPATEHITTAVTGVSCNIGVDSGTQILSSYLGDTAYSAGRFSVQPSYLGTTSGQDLYQIGAMTNLYFSKGKQPMVQIFVLGGVVHDFSCTISGYHS